MSGSDRIKDLESSLEATRATCSHAEAERDNALASLNQARLDLAKLTRDAAAECGRLRAELAEAQRHVEGFVLAGAQLCRERDALLAAVQATIDTFEPDDPHTEPTYDTPRGNARAALRAAVAACMLEEKQP